MKKMVRILSGPIVAMLAYFLLATVPNAFAAGPYTCTWTGAGDGSSFSDASNWSGCNSAAPQAGDNDNLVFNAISTSTPLNNDITGLNLTNLTISGAETGQVIINGNAFSISGGITDTATGGALANTINPDLTLTGDQTFDVSSSQDSLAINGNISLGISELLVTAGSISTNSVSFGGAFSGTGSLTFNGSGSEYDFFVPSPSYSGAVEIGSGVAVEIAGSMNALGTGAITVDNGGTLMVEDSNATDTLPNNLILSGTGATGQEGALVSCLDWVQPGHGGPAVGEFGALTGCTSSATTLTLSGTLTLAANTSVVNGDYMGGSAPANNATFDFTGTYTPAGFAVVTPSGSSTILSGDGLGSSSGGSSSGSGSTGSSTSTAPKTPNTGAGLISGKYGVILLITSLSAASLVYLAKRYNYSVFNKK